MTSLLARIVRRRSQAPPVPVVVYTRAQCCCCHKALDVLREFRGRHNLAIKQVDVDSDPTLAAEHGLSVPVVAIDGKVRFKGAVNPMLLGRLLANRGR